MGIINLNLGKIQELCNSNKVTINLKKTNYMIIKSKKLKVAVKGSSRELRVLGKSILREI